MDRDRIPSQPRLVLLTHVDDRFDTPYARLIGADAAAVLPMLEHRDFTFLVEDPATIWHLWSERIRKLRALSAADSTSRKARH